MGWLARAFAPRGDGTNAHVLGKHAMSLATDLAPHIPYLRRFARAMTGQQASGDSYVSAMLEALIADRTLFPADLGAKVGAYRTLIAMWSSVSVNNAREELGGIDANERILAIAPRPRQAFLLTAVEGFSQEEAARAMDVGVDELSGLLEEANRDIAEQVATDVMIIEDEPLIALDIEQMVEGAGHSVTGIARTHAEAIELFDKQRPGMILADIQLADGSSGIDAVNEILRSVTVPVIFITAFPERLLTGERPEPAFLVTKPFQPDMVRALISQAIFFDDADRPAI